MRLLSGRVQNYYKNTAQCDSGILKYQVTISGREYARSFSFLQHDENPETDKSTYRSKLTWLRIFDVELIKNVWNQVDKKKCRKINKCLIAEYLNKVDKNSFPQLVLFIYVYKKLAKEPGPARDLRRVKRLHIGRWRIFSCNVR